MLTVLELLRSEKLIVEKQNDDVFVHDSSHFVIKNFPSNINNIHVYVDVFDVVPEMKCKMLFGLFFTK